MFLKLLTSIIFVITVHITYGTELPVSGQWLLVNNKERDEVMQFQVAHKGATELFSEKAGTQQLTLPAVYLDRVPDNCQLYLTYMVNTECPLQIMLTVKIFDALKKMINEQIVEWNLSSSEQGLIQHATLRIPVTSCQLELSWQVSATAPNKSSFHNISLSANSSPFADGTGQWIKPVSENEYLDTMFFRYEFVLPTEAENGNMVITADNLLDEIYLNGQHVNLGKHSALYGSADLIDITPLLATGSNLLAVKAVNLDGSGGLLADLEIKLKDNQTLNFGTNDEWIAAINAPKGWELADFDASGWPPAIFLGPTKHTVWSSINRNVSKLPVERTAHDTIASAQINFNDSHVGRIESNNFSGELLHHWSGRVGTLNEEKIGFCRDNDISLYFGTMVDNWGGDYSQTDLYCNRLLSINPNAMINLFVGVDQMHDPSQRQWAEKNPEIWAVAEDSQTHFNIHGTPNTTIPSWASTIWLEEQARRVDGLIRHIQSSSYKDRVLGVSPVSGMGFEWIYWGANGGGKYPLDYSEVFRNSFQSFVFDKYSSLEEINRRYLSNYSRIEELELPTVLERRTGDWFGFLDPKKSQRVIDFREFISWVTSNAILRLAQTVKESSNGKMLFGTFYGYINYVTPPDWNESGHFALGGLLNSPDVDYLISLTSYGTRRPGEAGGFMFPEGSFLLHKKIPFVQTDIRTHLLDPASSESVYSRCSNLKESIAVVKREFVNTLIAGCGMEFGYFGRGWLTEDARLMQILGKARSIEIGNRDVNRLDPDTSIAYIVDEEASYYNSQHSWLHYYSVTMQLLGHAPYTGCGMDTFLLSDLELIPEYKCYIFLHTSIISPEKEKYIKEKLAKNGNILVFIHSPGIIDDNSINPQRVASITGIKMNVLDIEQSASIEIAPEWQAHFGKQYGNPNAIIGPIFVPQEGEIIGYNASTGHPALVKKQFDDYTVYYSAVPELSRIVLQAIAMDAGINIANTNSNDATYASDRLIGIHSASGGKRLIHAPDKYQKRAVELFTDKEYIINNGSFEITIEPMSTLLFRLD